MATPDAVMRYFAELAPAARKHALDHRPAVADFAILDHRRVEPDRPIASQRRPVAPQIPVSPHPLRWTVARTPLLDRLLAIERLHAHEHLLRLGWMFLVGTLTRDESTTTVWIPLAEAPARLTRVDRQRYSLTIDRELAMPASVFDLEVRDAMEDELADIAEAALASPGGLAAWSPRRSETTQRWVDRAAAHLGLGEPEILTLDASPMARHERLVVCPGIGVYTARRIDEPNIRGSLLAWAGRDLRETAFASMYDMGRTNRTRPPHEPIASPMPLNAEQQDAVMAARSQHVGVISGPPGTGKTHTAAAIAIDTVARGGSVLVCAQSDHAIEALVELFERYPGPRWIRFGSRHHLDRVADDLSGGRPARRSEQGMDSVVVALAEAKSAADSIRAGVVARLDAEQRFAAALQARDRLGWTVDRPPGIDPANVDWGEVETDVQRLTTGSPGPFEWVRRWISKSRLGSRFGSAWLGRLDEAGPVIEWGKAEATVAAVLARGGVSVTGALEQLEGAEEEVRRRVGEVIAYRREAEAGDLGDGGRAAAALATALRSGAATRRRLLRETQAPTFLGLLPLWLGTLSEIDDTLPMEPGMFDLVILDEASQINQGRAGAALSRGRRCVVVGDPRQLRHVSFVADRSMQHAASEFEFDPLLAATLDVRRNSIFDVAAGVAAVVELDEHFRSVPHIIGFSNRTFYDGRLRLMTTHPSNEARDAIDVVAANGTRSEAGVNEAEVELVLDRVRQIVDTADASTTIGVVSPFRAQADAIEEALLDAFDVETIDRAGLRVGTVHGFQGAERDVTVITLGIDADSGAGELRFLQDPHLFNVMVTRARRLVVVVSSAGPADALAPGLLRDYLRHAARPPRLSETTSMPRGWVGSLAERLEGYGLRVVPDYPVAGYTVDLAVGEGDEAVGVECGVHPNGADAHIARHLALRRAGWRMLDAFESRWLANPDAAVDEIVQAVLRASGRTPVATGPTDAAGQ
jgi:hypothetical protein